MNSAPMVARFAGLSIHHDDTVLAPRPWTAAQADWAHRLLDLVPEGPVLELCAGVGHIALAAVRGTGRDLVMVDRDGSAVALAARNAVAVDELVSLRHAPLRQSLGESERFALVLADPPWVPTAQVDWHPSDPPGAIDGGPDGLAVARECVGLIGRHLMIDGQALLQLGTTDQARAIGPDLAAAGLIPVNLSEHEGGVLLRIELEPSISQRVAGS